jgi:hypothetical protein
MEKPFGFLRLGTGSFREERHGNNENLSVLRGKELCSFRDEVQDNNENLSVFKVL